MHVLGSSLAAISRGSDGLNLYGGGGAVRVRVATHEAGHACLVAALGATPTRVWVDATGGRINADGSVSRGECTYNGGLPPLGMLLVSMAGPLAEEQLSAEVREWAGEPGHGEDRRNQERHLAAIGGDAATIRATAEPIVRGLLRTFAEDLDYLALRVLQRNELGRDDLVWFLLNARAYGQNRGRGLLTEIARRLAAEPRTALTSRQSAGGAGLRPSDAFLARYAPWRLR